jgi:hypothetical protein
MKIGETEKIPEQFVGHIKKSKDNIYAMPMPSVLIRSYDLRMAMSTDLEVAQTMLGRLLSALKTVMLIWGYKDDLGKVSVNWGNFQGFHAEVAKKVKESYDALPGAISKELPSTKRRNILAQFDPVEEGNE